MNHTEADMRTLVTKSAAGDQESSRKLYEHLLDKIFPFVRYRTTSQEEAVDLTQDVFIDFFGTIQKFSYQSDAQLYAYVFVITRRKLAQLYQRHTKEGTAKNETLDETYFSDGTHNNVVEKSDVLSALSQLEAQAQEIIVLHHWSLYTFGEIATLLGSSESAIRVRHHRAIAQLRKYFHTIGE